MCVRFNLLYSRFGYIFSSLFSLDPISVSSLYPVVFVRSYNWQKSDDVKKKKLVVSLARSRHAWTRYSLYYLQISCRELRLSALQNLLNL